MNPRPESRIKSLEGRTTDIEASLQELSSDQAEGLKDLKQDIKELDDGMRASFKTIGDTFVALETNLEAVKRDVADIKASMATKDDMTAMEARLIETMKQLLQQKPGGE